MEYRVVDLIIIAVKILLIPVVLFIWYAVVSDAKEMLKNDFSPIKWIDIIEYLVLALPLTYFILFF